MIKSFSTWYLAITCGFPGRPAYGYPQQKEDKFIEGAQVTYACNPGYYMVGKVVRRCLPNGTWTGNIPVCGKWRAFVGSRLNLTNHMPYVGPNLIPFRSDKQYHWNQWPIKLLV